MYDLPSFVIVGVLFVTMILAIETGHRVGLRTKGALPETLRTQITAIQGAILGILALLLGFTFSLALQRYDSRSEAVVAEANAIGTAFLRADLLPEALRGKAKDTLRRYVDLRVEAGGISLERTDERAAIGVEVTRLHGILWDDAVRAAAMQPNPVSTGLFIQSLNEAIDAYGSRNASLDRHVPELVLLLLYGTFLMTGLIVGYASGTAGIRASFTTYIMVALIVLLVFIILDLDRPRRGIIRIDQQAMVELQRSMSGSP